MKPNQTKTKEVQIEGDVWAGAANSRGVAQRGGTASNGIGRRLVVSERMEGLARLAARSESGGLSGLAGGGAARAGLKKAEFYFTDAGVNCADAGVSRAGITGCGVEGFDIEKAVS
jgi:hypothetical protein